MKCFLCEQEILDKNYFIENNKTSHKLCYQKAINDYAEKVKKNKKIS